VIEVRLAVAVSALIVATGIAATGASCNGCSPQCQGEQRPAGCPCQSDQDCTTKGGVVLLCTTGTCKAGNPPDAPGTHCTTDAQCKAGEACGVDDVCLPAPKCQRVDDASAPLSFVAEPSGATGPLASATQADCRHTWSATARDASSFAVDVTIGLDGAMTVTDHGSVPPCTGGAWRAGARVGELDCGATTWFIGPADALTADCNGDAGTCQ
jgi:hypothetical protein